MVRRIEPESEPANRDERLGEAIETYLALAEGGQAPAPEVFAAGYPDLGDDLVEALEGLALVRGLVGEADRPGHRLESGRRIAGYRIVRELGRGGMGVVYEAVHVGLDRPVALKVLGAQAAPDSSGRRRFLNEARTAAGLHHTHIVPVFDVGQVGGLCYYAMQRIEGCGLDRVLKRLRRERTTGAGTSTGSGPARTPPVPSNGNANGNGHGPASGSTTRSWGASASAGLTGLAGPAGGGGPDDEGEPAFEPPRGSAYYRWVAAVGREAAEALAHAHQRGVIHRDVKPSNLLVDARGSVWVADFGLARRLADPGLTQLDSLLGTPRYMSPEQARTGPIDGRTDVYSLGATLYELLTLRPPFDGRTAAELVDQIGRVDPVSPRRRDGRIPRDLETIVLKCLAKRQVDRYASAAEVADDLGRFLDHEPVRARRIGPIGRAWRFARRHPSQTAVSASAAAVVVAVAAVAYARVVQERNAVQSALGVAENERLATRKALEREEQATEMYRAAAREAYWREASVIRLSSVPNRRATGLDRLRQAAELGPISAEFRTRLRDEAAEFLVLRDVRARAELPAGKTRAAAFGSRDRRLATLSDDGQELAFWDLSAADEPRRLSAHALGAGPEAGAAPDRPGQRGAVMTPMASAGQFLAVVAPSGRGLRLFDATHGAPLGPRVLADRQILAVHAAPGSSRIVTVERYLVEKPPEPGNGSGGNGNGRRFVAGSRVNLWDPDRLDEPARTLADWPDLAESAEGPPAPPTFPLVSVAPDGRLIALARSRRPGVTLFSSADGAERGQVETQGEVNTLALGPLGQLAVATGGGAVRLWDAETQAPLSSLGSHQGRTRLLRFSPDGSLLALAGYGADVELWDPSTGALVAALPTSDLVDDLAFSADGRALAAAGRATTVSLWDVVPPIGRTRLGGFGSPALAMAFRGDLLAFSTWDGSVRSWEPGRCASGASRPGHAAGPGEEATTAAGAAVGAAAPIRGGASGGRSTAVTFDDRGRLVAAGVEGLRIWAGPPAASEPAELRLPEVVGWSAAGAVALARVGDGHSLILGRGRDLFRWQADRPDALEPLELASEAGDRGRPRDRDRPRDRRPPPPDGPGPGPGGPGRDRDRGPGGPAAAPWRLAAASPDGSRLHLVDFGSNLVTWTFSPGPEGPGTPAWRGPSGVTALALSPDGTVLALGDDSGAVTLCDAADGRTLGRLEPPAADGDNTVTGLAFAPDGRELACGTSQGTVRLWSLGPDPRPIVRLPGHHGRITALAYDEDGDRLASGAFDKNRNVDIWDLGRVRAELAALGLGW